MKRKAKLSFGLSSKMFRISRKISWTPFHTAILVAFILACLYMGNPSHMFYDTFCTVEPMDDNDSNIVKLRPFIIREQSRKMSDLNDYPVYFIESSCKNYVSPRFLCSVESFAHHNPDTEIRILLISSYIKDTNFFLQDLVSVYKNINFFTYKCGDFFVDTPLQKLYESKRWSVAYRNLQYWHLSDMLRLALLSKTGGFYADYDILCLKDIASLRNTLGLESNGSVNNAILSFRKKHPFLNATMQLIADTFEPYIWAKNGPDAITLALKTFCNVKTVEQIQSVGPVACEGLTVQNISAFYPISMKETYKMFEDLYLQELMQAVENSYTVHWTNHLRSETAFGIGSSSFFSKVAKDNCPMMHQLLKERNMNVI